MGQTIYLLWQLDGETENLLALFMELDDAKKYAAEQVDTTVTKPEWTFHQESSAYPGYWLGRVTATDQPWWAGRPSLGWEEFRIDTAVTR